MKAKNHPALRLVWSRGDDSIGYRSGRNLCREIPVRDSILRTRSDGVRPRAIQPDTVPCERKPSSRAKAVCPLTASQAARSASFGVMDGINAQTGNAVNAETGNARVNNTRMPKKSILPPSAFWRRLDEALGEKWSPLNPNSVASRLKMSQGSVHRWFTGEGLPEFSTALALSKESGVCVDWLMSNVKPKYPISKDPLLRELFEICEDLTPEARERVLRTARGEFLQQLDAAAQGRQEKKAIR